MKQELEERNGSKWDCEDPSIVYSMLDRELSKQNTSSDTFKRAQSSSKIWKVLFRIVSMTRTCQPASAMLPPELAPIKVGLECVVSKDLGV